MQKMGGGGVATIVLTKMRLTYADLGPIQVTVVCCSDEQEDKGLLQGLLPGNL